MKSNFDVLVVGGGIIGAAAGHHLASAGFDTLLVEKDDYASATSSRTSRMHNCGFMYFLDAKESVLKFLLRPGRFFSSLELARRTMRERSDFVRSSPDRVRKLDFYIPLDKSTGMSRFRMRMGAMLLQFLDGYRLSLEPRFLNEAQASAHPLLKQISGRIRGQGAFCFAEYQYVWPERIVLDTILKAREAGLDARNYTRLVGLDYGAGMWKATLEQGHRTYTVTAKAIVNAAGAWVDHVTRLASATAIGLNSGAKGVNLLVRLPSGMRGLGMETVTARGTPFYLMPWGEFHYLGPADSPSDAVLDGFRVTDDEIARILADANALMPDLELRPEHVVYSWAGVRPRTRAEGEELGSMEVREHDLSTQGLQNFIVFTGGLIMTHRDAGRRLLRAVHRHIPASGKPRPIDYCLSRQVDEDRVTPESVRRAIQVEQAVTLSDILRRRLSVGWAPDLGFGVAEEASRLAAATLDWSEDERLAQLAAYRSEVEQSFRPKPELAA